MVGLAGHARVPAEVTRCGARTATYLEPVIIGTGWDGFDLIKLTSGVPLATGEGDT
jgi:hypothetical protein